jgi:hypothetical protein
VAGSVGIDSNKYITPAESKEVSNQLNEYLNNGINAIVANSSGVKSAVPYRRPLISLAP